MKKKFILTILFVLSIQLIHGQTRTERRFKKYQEELEEQQKKQFPSPLSIPFPSGSLGEKIQVLYELQAKEACGIIRSDERLFIPKEIVSGYGEDRLRNTFVYDIPISSENLLFLALTPSDVTKINNGRFNEDEYVRAKRIIGINDDLINFGQSVLSPINGFPSLFYQKSCGSYFVGDVSTKIKAPIAELESSLDAETKKSTSITTVTGNFFSPLYLILRQNTAQSTYAHLLLWEIYYEDHKGKPDTSEFLYNRGKYISEFKATMCYRAINSEQSINMNGRLSTNISFGLFDAKGSVIAGNENKVSFDLRDFKTSIHKLSNNNLSWDLVDLPRIEEINRKLQNSTSFKAQPSMNGLVTHILPTEITRVLVGVPAYLCNSNSWSISQNGYNTDIWKQKPTVTSTHVVKGQDYPECICKITGYLKKEAITNAVKTNGFIELLLELESSTEIAGKRLKLSISEPTVKVTDNPKLSNINTESVNALREEAKALDKVFYRYPLEFAINSTGVQLTQPYKISNIQIEYLNKEDENQFSVYSQSITAENMVKLELKSTERPQSFIQQGEMIIPIKIKFNIELMGGTLVQLVTNTINLSLPNLVKAVDIKSNVD